MPKRIKYLARWVVQAALATMTIANGSSLAWGQTRGSGNPTPGTPQPATPNLADRITVTGCVRAAAATPGAPPAANAGEPSDSRFVLTNVKRESRVPPRAGTSPAATSPTSDTYRLAAIDAALSPFVGTRVEISGQIETASPEPAQKADAKPPVLRVEFVQKLAATCQ